ncbi:1,4-butanediol diacrylate esterase [Nakamurella endophytica]|uniref:1,4-butanediol diacrylate esterase n=1 Tax=Nakamurella endophytica TaxID=1748367 RepID=A0A917WDD2_9ACTN|nr:1,4-butanediol diacrylate esterase [Nakamurella endophytica]
MNAERIDRVLSAAVAAGAAPGAVAVVADRDGPVYTGSVGVADPATGRTMEPDALFRIASMTKMVNAVAVLQLCERGALELDSPVADLIPDFDRIQVLDGWDGDRPRLRRPAVRATVRHLLTHTSGLTYDVLHPELYRYIVTTGRPMPSSGLRRSLDTPMVTDPGSEWNYGMSTDWTGQVVEAASGQPLDDYYRDHIFAPLGLRDITFRPDQEQRRRLVPVAERTPDGFTRTAFEFPAEPEFLSAGHGLYATAGDYLAIQRALLAGGHLGATLLSPESVAAMFRPQLGAIAVRDMRSQVAAFSADMHLPPGASWGLDVLVTTAATPGLRSTGSVGWWGTFNTFYWIDPAAGLCAALYLQTLPFCDPAALALAENFERAVYAGAADGRVAA